METDNYTPEVGDDTYLNMEKALPRDDGMLKFFKVTKRLWDGNVILIGTANDNSILDTRKCEVKYIDDHMASLSANAIATNIFLRKLAIKAIE